MTHTPEALRSGYVLRPLAFPGTDDGRTVDEVDAHIKAANLLMLRQEVVGSDVRLRRLWVLLGDECIALSAAAKPGHMS